MYRLPSRLLGSIFAGVFATCCTANALDAVAAPQETTTQKHPHFLKDLGLTDAQKAQIKEIRKETPRGKERHKAILAVLTPEQQTKLRAEKQQWKTFRGK